MVLKDKFHQLVDFFRTHYKTRVGSIVVGLVVIAAGLALVSNYLLSGKPLQINRLVSSDSGKVAEARNIPSPINGTLFTATDASIWQNRTPLAVIIENSVDSRPQSGLSYADVVYETLAEGGITRQMGVFLTNLNNQTVGPVRSMRVYFLDWLEEYNALAAHVGGNHFALDRVGPEGVKNLDEFFTSGYWRATDRPAPHNVYTTTDNLWSAGANNGWTGMTTFHQWPFKDEASASARPTTQHIGLGFLGGADYKVVWDYNPTTNNYQRNVGGSQAIDKNTGNQITAKTVVVQVVSYTPFNDGTGALDMDDIGSGPAYIFRDGGSVTGTWKKASRTDRTMFVDANNNEIPFNRGPIWIEVVPPGSSIVF